VDRQTIGLEVIGAESLGVRSLSCRVTLPDQRIVIDPDAYLSSQPGISKRVPRWPA